MTLTQKLSPMMNFTESLIQQLGRFIFVFKFRSINHFLTAYYQFREWKDGLFSVIMRDQANLTSEGPKWIILDGDIDPMWIESLNTVM